MATRLDRLRQRLSEESLDAFFVTNPESRRYLSNFRGHDSGVDSAGRLIVTVDDAVLVTDGRTAEQARDESPAFRVHVPPTTIRLTPALAALLREMGVRRIGFEAEHLTVALRDKLVEDTKEEPAVTWVSTTGIVAPLRRVKDAEELRLIRRAQEITDAAYAHAQSIARVGLTELQLAWEIEQFMRAEGAEGLAFETIVATGPNAAKPHAVPSDREIRAGEVILLDMGARVDGYHSDMTRCFVLGEPEPKLRKIHALVQQAQELVEQRLRAGMKGADADALARDLITKAGYGDHFTHGLGHGVGLEIHEAPSLGRLASEDELQPGNVVTVEPGVYLPGWGGIRIEDMGVLTDTGLEVFTRSPKQLDRA